MSELTGDFVIDFDIFLNSRNLSIANQFLEKHKIYLKNKCTLFKNSNVQTINSTSSMLLLLKYATHVYKISDMYTIDEEEEYE